MRNQALSLLQKFTQAHGASGAETEVRRLLVAELAAYPVSADKTGNLYFEPAAPAPAGAPRVMVTAHMDEIGFMVQDITADGFVKFVPIGGWTENTLLAQRVRLRTRAGREIPGVICSLPPHFATGNARTTTPDIDKLFIDLGAESRGQVLEWGLALGDLIVPDGPFQATAHPDRFLAKAFDNRVGVAAMAQVMQRVSGKNLPCRPVAVGTVQEEVGCRGAGVAAPLARPDVALVLEGPPADDTPGFSRAESQGRLAGGVQIRLYDPTAIMSRELAEFCRAVAQKRGIPCQLTVRRGGGTDARAIQHSGLGVPTVVLGVPARYIHTHAGMIDLRDQLACVALTEALLEELTPEVVAGFTRFL